MSSSSQNCSHSFAPCLGWQGGEFVPGQSFQPAQPQQQPVQEFVPGREFVSKTLSLDIPQNNVLTSYQRDRKKHFISLSLSLCVRVQLLPSPKYYGVKQQKLLSNPRKYLTRHFLNEKKNQSPFSPGTWRKR